MGMPPKDADAGELWLRLASRERPSIDIPFPGKGTDGQPLGTVKIWVLHENELQACRTNAGRYAVTMLRGPDNAREEVDVRSQAYADIYYNELMIQLVSIGCRNAEHPQFAAFPSAKVAREKLTTDEFAVLAKAIANWRVESGPIVAELSKDELDAWVTLLMEGGSIVPLASLSLEAHQELIRHLVSRLKTSQTDNGSVGSQPDAQSTEKAPPLSDLVGDADMAGVKE